MDKENGDHQDRRTKKAKVMTWIDTVDTIPEDWKLSLKAEIESEYFAKIIAFLDSQKCIIYPPRELVFNALIQCPLDRIKVVIIGQDPYHGEAQAHGLSFSVLEPTKPPPSLKNIYKELASDIEGFLIPKSGDLTKWASQGVLLLNASLTVEKGKANSHSKIGWFKFTDSIIKTVNANCSNWGKFAEDKQSMISSKHIVLTAPHPSPLSARRGWFGCKHFSKTNSILQERGLEPIDWKL